MEILKTVVGQSPLLLSMPHSGRHLPPTLESRLTPEARQIPDTDWHIPSLYDFAADLDTTVIQANYNRIVVDLNRPKDDTPLYPDQAGNGVCPEQLFDGSPVYFSGEEPDDEETDRRIRQYWQPYHETLKSEIQRIRALHGYVILYDCHSIKSYLPRLFEGELPVLNLGTYHGQSCSGELQDRLLTYLANCPFGHAFNDRFVGGYITRNYGDPDHQVHALQMEIGQSAYMTDPDEFNHALAAPLQRALEEMLQILLHWRPGQESFV